MSDISIIRILQPAYNSCSGEYSVLYSISGPSITWTYMAPPPLLLQTTYAELLERCRATAFRTDFPQDGAFVVKTIKGQRYWYFQRSTSEGREQKYVGPETPELLDQITHHKQIRGDERERRSLVSTLVRSFGLQPPASEIGEVVNALANAGVFRLRSVLVGTVAYQTYSAMLGTRLPRSILQTSDVDIAQFSNVSVAVGDRIPVLDVLKQVDKTFRPIPHLHKGNVTSYVGKGGIRVDFITPNQGRDTDIPKALPALQTEAEPLRFLDFLISDPEPAVVLHGVGIYVLVPSPARYAVHKLIVSRRRPEGVAKRQKDIDQAASLFVILAEKNPYELKSAWREASGRGKTWDQLILEGLSQLPINARDVVLKAVSKNRNIVPGIDLTFNNPPPRYDFRRDIVAFAGKSLGDEVRCAVSREALADHFGANNVTNEGRVEAFRKNRTIIEHLAREKYLHRPVEEPGQVILKTQDISGLRKAIAKENRAS
jgi:hypothetical protein